MLDDAGVVRRDIRSSFGCSTTTAPGVPLTITLTVTDGGAPMAGASVYLWHCDRDGRYSLCSEGVEDENYLCGVQVADAAGTLSFTSIHPACYDGRWPQTVYATPGYEQSVRNLAGTSLDADNLFDDGHDLQVAAVAGSVAAGYAVTLAVPV